MSSVTLQAPPDCWFYDVWNTNSLATPAPSGSCSSVGLHDLEVRVAHSELDLGTPFADLFSTSVSCGSYTGAAAPGALVTVRAVVAAAVAAAVVAAVGGGEGRELGWMGCGGTARSHTTCVTEGSLYAGPKA